MINNEIYSAIFKRKSFHNFKDIGDAHLSREELEDLTRAFESFDPLFADIRTAIKIVPANETNCRRGNEYCVFFYSEEKPGYQENIGYLGEQLDLYLVSRNIGTLWYGMGRTSEKDYDGLRFVIMMGIAKVENMQCFRSEATPIKRKPVEEMWEGEVIKGVAEIARLAPSAVNTQPWLVEHVDNILSVYRYSGRRGMVPANVLTSYIGLDVGIFLCFLELCLQHEQIPFDRKVYAGSIKKHNRALVAKYLLKE